ncbi:hypothetical protein PUNSTDRAFT_53847 [Punctularia strigosozonata HHB-11173 SS5]|uniref:uncharacterized protein n=1 Tax=Punctularia strigosozonata (strain HHB-11173) TaxID=741275 RepID=UPI0004416455|nr:uncharacterized protein PUNSTDRAFT_53847 [Punctularia strigosozonata HHB-11173 SS5]EIN06367.1 hypothetical protein PUNSTDRAFT_53847 [Punctularia strigosozonata HHB-11173 SS5]
MHKAPFRRAFCPKSPAILALSGPPSPSAVPSSTNSVGLRSRSLSGALDCLSWNYVAAIEPCDSIVTGTASVLHDCVSMTLP